MALERFESEVNACVRFLVAGQHRDGYWQGKWFPSRLITTHYAARLCKQFPETCADALARAQAFVLQGQHLNGSWNDSVIDTANAILLLRETEGLNDACKRGEKWLVNRKKPLDGPGNRYFITGLTCRAETVCSITVSTRGP